MNNNRYRGNARHRPGPGANWRAQEPGWRNDDDAAAAGPGAAGVNRNNQHQRGRGPNRRRELGGDGHQGNFFEHEQRNNQFGNMRRPERQNRFGAGENRDDVPRNRSERCMGFRMLEEITRLDNNDALMKICEKKTSFLNLLASVIDKGDLYVLIIEAISKVCNSSFDELKLKLLLDICNSGFLVNLRNYLMDLPYVEVKAKNNLYWRDQKMFWDNFYIFCECIVSVSPSTALLKCRSLIEGITRVCLDALRERHDFTLAEEYNTKLSQLRERLKFYEKEEEDKKPEERPRHHPAENEEPPEDFRLLSLTPSREDLLDHQQFLRPNIVRGGYRDVEHYLDVQFRLLREDCFGPLREGITQFIENPSKKKYDNIRIYHNVKFLEPYISKSKVGQTIQLDEKTVKRNRRINWAHSKRFIFGSLLLFTKDNCKSFMTATILERDIKLLQQGKIPISIIGTDKSDNIYEGDPYIMIESEVYFEPYFHVLKALQDSKFPEHLAMAKYIVHVDPLPNPPQYLQPETVFAVQTNIGKTRFCVLDEETWPSREDLSLNESQYDAFKLALTHECAVIQGPPGTGKTFLGVKVAKTLLENPIAKVGCQMLVICYTNHALDQFLEAIMPVTRSIVRIGGQSRNENMDKFNLTTLRKNNQIEFDSRRVYLEHRNNLRWAVRELQEVQDHLDRVKNGVVSFYSLKDFPEVEALGQYYSNRRNDIEADPLVHWLFENMTYTNFDTIEIAGAVDEQNGGNEVFDNIDDDIKRMDFILDEFDDDGEQNDHRPTNIISVNMGFDVADTEKKLKILCSLYYKTKNLYRQAELQQQIVELRSRINWFNAMTANRRRETRLHINNRMNLGVMPMEERWALYFRWANALINKMKRRMKPLQESLESANTAYEEVRMMLDVNILKNKKVVGMTTSGAARLRKLLQALAPPIVIVEEAAEVLEQHIVTSLTKDCQHLILIGDHQQLRPSAAHMKLARHYNIEISLFERMITNGIHSRRLSVQHRMRPELATLIVPHIYSDLKNHPTVEHFPRVRGMTDNLFFLTHDFKEEEVEDSSSRSNQLEADMALKLANYLMQQGYDPEDLTVLAAYSGQMFYMRKQRERYAYLSRVKITVVDNYQGEESKIIILSLVRNNDHNKIGFLGTENRVCVALSRAREGFYILGNMPILQKNSELWAKIATTLENSASIGAALMLKCENHENITTVSTPKDFEAVPEGGCLQKCDYNLSCGHRCPLLCHGYDRSHNNIKCFLNCERILCELGHVCPLLCHQDCEPCKRLVEKTLPCGHKMKVPCHKDPRDPTVKCLTVINVKLPKCGHTANKLCHIAIESVKCPVSCIYRVSKCGHECRLTCHVDDDPDHEKYLCQKMCAKAKKGCTAELLGDRGDHQCPKQCYEVCDDCTVEVKKRRKCGHTEKVACHVDVNDKQCNKNCVRLMSCGHRCKKKCHEPCGDCTQKVTKIIPECNHKIEVMCMKVASRELCKEMCERRLNCGHRCTQRCGQECNPELCTQVVQKQFKAPCGHNVSLPCNVYNSMINEWKPEVLMDYCAEPCAVLLACEHYCGGTCGRCHQGRLHVPCRENCQRLNICGHQCNEPCNQVCPPCEKMCEIKCPHTQCNKVCGAPCKPCQEKCRRSCVHGSCKNRCGEPCSRAPCDEACPRRLPCGHPCRGLCGEPCPGICNVCRPEQFPKDFLGDDFDDDVKFIQLQDCPHVLAVEDMDNLMTGDQETVSIRTCPMCRTPIINTSRYKDIINNMLKKEINKVKEKVYGNEKQIKLRREQLFQKVNDFAEETELIAEENMHFNKALVQLKKVLITQKKPSLLKIEMQFQYIEILDMIAECYRKYKDANLIALEKELLGLMNFICLTLRSNVHKISQQFQSDVGNEIKRMNSIIQLAKIQSHSSYLNSKEVPAVREAANEATKIVLCNGIFNQDKAIVSLKQLQEKVKISGIVTKEERDLIVKAIGSKAGSWYKCPNGHFYSISHCGGAMERSKCVDCGAAIGGQNHALLPNNAHAGEVDGSSYAAWSDTYNVMGNFEL